MMADTFEQHLATPIVIHPEMDEAGFLYELARMRVRESATSEFVAGRLEVADYLDILDGSGVDVDTALTTWSLGLSLMN